MKYEKFECLLNCCAEISKEFEAFYLEFKERLNEEKKGIDKKLKLEIGDFYYFFDVWPFDKQKNQKQTLLLISKYNKEKSILFNSFRFDIQFMDKTIVYVINWKRQEDDYLTQTKEIVLNPHEFSV